MLQQIQNFIRNTAIKDFIVNLCIVLVSLLVISGCSKCKTYTVFRNNYHDTLYIKADTFKVNIREHTVYFISDNRTINRIDSINKISKL